MAAIRAISCSKFEVFSRNGHFLLCLNFAPLRKIMVYLTRVEHFNAAHKLYNPAWTREQNDEVFGKCANENWHGHNFELFVTVKGNPNPDTGFIVDAKS